MYKCKRYITRLNSIFLIQICIKIIFVSTTIRTSNVTTRPSSDTIVLLYYCITVLLLVVTLLVSEMLNFCTTAVLQYCTTALVVSLLIQIVILLVSVMRFYYCTSILLVTSSVITHINSDTTIYTGWTIWSDPVKYLEN